MLSQQHSSCSANTSGWWGRAGILMPQGKRETKLAPLPQPIPCSRAERENWARQEGERGMLAH